MTRPMLAVVIPYYQRQSGILSATLRSVLAQEGFEDYQVIVVDDESPVPAEHELAQVSDPDGRVQVVLQENQGPGAARNAGLDRVPTGTRYVALMDSDDQWEPTFLRDAVHALESGYDAFLGNSCRTDLERTRFEWDEDKGYALRTGDHREIDSTRGLYAFEGDFFDFIVHRSSVVGPSSMIFRLDRAPHLRYDTTLYNGQDRLFKLKLFQHIQKVAFSPAIYAREGRGVNIFDSAQWGSERSLLLLASYLEMCKRILDEVELTVAQRDYVQQHLNNTRYSFAATLAHQLRQRRSVRWDTVSQTFRTDPMTLISLPANLLRVLRRKAKPGPDVA